VNGKLKTNDNFQHSVCTRGVVNRAVEERQGSAIDNAGQLECVDRFCYLDDVIGDEG
jgi:hypothetical protein